MRLQRTFIWASGHTIYPDFETGPIINSIYGPVSAMAYWPATLVPFLQSVPVGAACAALFFFTPPVILFLKGRFGKTKHLALCLSCALCFILMSALLSSLKRSAFTIHADAPALGFAAMACAFIYWKRRFRNEWLPLFLSALFAVLAVGSKQTTVPIAIALPLFVLYADGRKSFFKYLAALGICAAFFAAACAVLFNLNDMFDSMVRMPSRHPMKTGGTRMILKAVSRILRENILVVGVSLPATWHLFIRRKKSLRAWTNANRWILFWVIASFMVPLALMSSIKIGGSNNTLSFISYFTLIGTLLAFSELFRPLRKNRLHRFAAKTMIFYTVLLTVITAPLVFYRLADHDNDRFLMKDAYNYALAHPGTSYFPRFTIIHLAAENKIYHEVEGLNDRIWANLPFSREHFEAYIPKNLKVIGFSGEDHRGNLPIEGFKRESRDYPELEGFVVYTNEPETSEP